MSIILTPKTPADARRLAFGTERLKLEDPAFSVSIDAETGAAEISANGEVELEIVVDRLRRDFDVEASSSPPRIAYLYINGVRHEPVMRVVIDVPTECVSDVVRGLSQRRGDILSIRECDTCDAVVARVPLIELFGYQHELWDLTQGRGAHRTAFERYEPCQGGEAPRDPDAVVGSPLRRSPSGLLAGIALPEPPPDDDDDDAGNQAIFR